MTFLGDFLQLPTEYQQSGGDLLWVNGNAGVKDQLFEVYAADEFQIAGTRAADVLLRRGISDTAELLQHLLKKPILITESSFETIKNIQPFGLSDLLTSVGSVGNLRALSGPAVAKIMLEVDDLPENKKNELQPFLGAVYKEEPVRKGSSWRPAPRDDKERRQIAFMAFIHGLHALAAVTVTIDPLNRSDRIPALQATIPSRYVWVTTTLNRQAAETGGTLFGLKRPAIAHFLADMFESMTVPLPDAVTGELADTAKLIQLLQSPLDVWEQIIEGMLLDTMWRNTKRKEVPTYTPEGMAGFPTPSTMDFSFEDLPSQEGYSVSNVLDNISVD